MSSFQEDHSLLRLYPMPHESQSLYGVYQMLDLHRQAVAGDVLIYANYISSVDGRISLFHEQSGEFAVPASIANKRDWRLYQELAAQADVMITSARYFRQLAKGQAQDLLPVGMEPAYADLLSWRKQQGLKAQPDVVVISNSLDIPLSALDKLQGRTVSVLTGCGASAEKLQRLKQADISVHVFETDAVSGSALKQWLIDASYRSAYMIAGPEVHRTLISAQVLDRLFLTTHLSLLGGDRFHTVLSDVLDQPAKLSLLSLYLDQSASNHQLFAQYALQRE
ncbi:5-amino-6-(5-phosphoribosylamino)uracil reductase [Mariprofundus micogutta]|uniref:5-amino-6-(5-phosphoribosylamino)uracil reductase n=1 Tax=Mariprofundus micogutta TaxID=1921010 RepID=A0A1L8CK07_9PROT|nr:dihydrofolate reductase family protein [Mariprofundus micogutta]GAV19236.1 5-amino-6-(5-phosphoribosylamino)uracil reductase [Mariprofundus micogutta]